VENSTIPDLGDGHDADELSQFYWPGWLLPGRVGPLNYAYVEKGGRHMSVQTLLRILGVALVSLIAATVQAKSEKPNILVIWGHAGKPHPQY
jgi:hypothetical protein